MDTNQQNTEPPGFDAGGFNNQHIQLRLKQTRQPNSVELTPTHHKDVNQGQMVGAGAHREGVDQPLESTFNFTNNRREQLAKKPGVNTAVYHNSHKQQAVINSSTPLTPVAVSSRKAGQMVVNLDEFRGITQHSCMSANESINKSKGAMGGTGDNLKSIDEYKAQINNQIRPSNQNNQKAVIATARNGIAPLITTSNTYDRSEGTPFQHHFKQETMGSKQSVTGSGGSSATHARHRRLQHSRQQQQRTQPNTGQSLAGGTSEEDFMFKSHEYQMHANRHQTDSRGYKTEERNGSNRDQAFFSPPQGSSYQNSHQAGFLPSIDKNNQTRNVGQAEGQQRTPSNLRHREFQGGPGGPQGATMSLLNPPQTFEQALQMSLPKNQTSAVGANAANVPTKDVLQTLQQQNMLGSKGKKRQSDYESRVNKLLGASTSKSNNGGGAPMSQQQQQMLLSTQAQMKKGRNLNAPQPANQFNNRASAMKGKEDRQLEDLNETLQRLAREKLTGAKQAGAAGSTTRRKNPPQRMHTNGQLQMDRSSQLMEQNISAMGGRAGHTDQGQFPIGTPDQNINMRQQMPTTAADSNNQKHVSLTDQSNSMATSSPSTGQRKDKKRKSKKSAKQIDLLQQRLESQQRSALIMGDNIMNQRLQGIKEIVQTQQLVGNEAYKLQQAQLGKEGQILQPPQPQQPQTHPANLVNPSQNMRNALRPSPEMINIGQVNVDNQSKKVYRINLTNIKLKDGSIAPSPNIMSNNGQPPLGNPQEQQILMNQQPPARPAGSISQMTDIYPVSQVNQQPQQNKTHIQHFQQNGPHQHQLYGQVMQGNVNNGGRTSPPSALSFNSQHPQGQSIQTNLRTSHTFLSPPPISSTPLQALYSKPQPTPLNPGAIGVSTIQTLAKTSTAAPAHRAIANPTAEEPPRANAITLQVQTKGQRSAVYSVHSPSVPSSPTRTQPTHEELQSPTEQKESDEPSSVSRRNPSREDQYLNIQMKSQPTASQQAAQQTPQQSAPKSYLKLKINQQQFSSVIEDIAEEQGSPQQRHKRNPLIIMSQTGNADSGAREVPKGSMNRIQLFNSGQQSVKDSMSISNSNVGSRLNIAMIPQEVTPFEVHDRIVNMPSEDYAPSRTPLQNKRSVQKHESHLVNAEVASSDEELEESSARGAGILDKITIDPPITNDVKPKKQSNDLILSVNQKQNILVGNSLNLTLSKERLITSNDQQEPSELNNDKDTSRQESNDTARNLSGNASTNNNHVVHRGFVTRRNSKLVAGSNSGGPRKSSRRSVSKGASNSNLRDSVAGAVDLNVIQGDLLQVQKIAKNNIQTPRGALASMSIDSEDFLKQSNGLGMPNTAFGNNPNESHQSINYNKQNQSLMAQKPPLNMTVAQKQRQIQKMQTQQIEVDDMDADGNLALPTIKMKIGDHSLAQDKQSNIGNHSVSPSNQLQPSTKSSPTKKGQMQNVKQGFKGQKAQMNESRMPQKGSKGTYKANDYAKNGNKSIQRAPSQISVQSNGYQSSDAPEAITKISLGYKTAKDTAGFCTGYAQHKGLKIPRAYRHMFTEKAYRKQENQFAWSQRLFLSRECAMSEDRRMQPVLIVNIDGLLGYWDDRNKNYYVLRPKIIEGLINLSYDFRIVAVSSQRKKLICKLVYSLMNLPVVEASGQISFGNENGKQEKQQNNGPTVNLPQMRHLVFDAVYQLRTQNRHTKYSSSIKNIDEIHFDLTQVLIDMQFKRQKQLQCGGEGDEDGKILMEDNKEKFETFWETEEYRPFKKVIVLTTQRYLEKSLCYGFDYNYLFQAQKFKNEQSKASPVIITMPHLRLNPKITFEAAHQLIFTLQNVAQAISCGKQEPHKIIDGKLLENPEHSNFEICKKLLSSKYKTLETKMRKTCPAKGLRVFDQKNDCFVNLELINFGEAYSFMKKYFSERSSDWIKVKNYKLAYKPDNKKELSPQKIKQNLKVTFNESPEIRRIGDDQSRDKAGSRAAATTHDSSKSDRFSIVKNQYISEEAKNLYNGLMIRNYKIQQEINSYARHFRIQNQRKINLKKQIDQQNENSSPIVIYDGDKETQLATQRQLKSALKANSSFKNREEELQTQPDPHAMPIEDQEEKEYAFKYRVIKIKSQDPPEEAGEVDLTKFQVVNLKSKLTKDAKGSQAQQLPLASVLTPALFSNQPQTLENGEKLPQYSNDQLHYQITLVQTHTAHAIHDNNDTKNHLVDLLSKRQNKISYSTNQEMHLKNNLNQLLEGEQQYKEQQQKLTQDEKEQQQASGGNANSGYAGRGDNNDKDNKNEGHYLDKL